MTGVDPSVGAPERLHPLYLVTGLGGGLRQLLGGYAAIGYLAATGKLRTALLLAAGVAVVTVVGVLFHWRRFEYRVGASEIRIDSGFINRTHRSIPFDRIQDVDISQGPVARLLGLAKVKFETGGSAGAKDDDGALAAIALPRAVALRDLIRARRGAAVDPVAAAAAEPAPIYAMDLRRLLLSGLFGFSLAVIAGLFGATQTLGDVAGFDIFARRFWRDALAVGSPLADLVLAHRLAAATAGALLLALIGLGTGIGRSVMRDYRFRLDRTAIGLRRRRGLFTLTDVTLPIRRVQAAIIGSGPLRDRFGWSDLRLQSLAQDEGKKGDHVVAPLANDTEIAAILAELGWRPVDPAVAWRSISPYHAWAFTGFASLLLIPAAIAMALVPWAGLAALLTVAAAVATRWLAWRRARFAVDGDRLLIRSGWWKRRLIVLPIAAIQSADVVDSVVSRRFGIAALAVGVASGRGYASHGIPALPRAAALALRDLLLGPFIAVH